MNIQTKCFGSFVVKDAEKGEVEAVVAEIGVVDADKDVFLRGSTRPNKVKLSYYGHDVVKKGEPPVGIGTLVEKDGKVVLQGRFFLTTDRGREAFEVVKALGPDGQWSVGFPNASVLEQPLTQEWKAKGAKRLIAGYDAVEASPVFMGAQKNTYTVSTKADESLSDRMEAVHNALWARNDAAREAAGEQADPEAYWYAHEIFEDHVIVRAGAKMMKVAYTLDAEGTVALGEAIEVEVVYQPVEKKEEAKTAEEEVEQKETAEELEAKRIADELSAKMQEELADINDGIRRRARVFGYKVA